MVDMAPSSYEKGCSDLVFLTTHREGDVFQNRETENSGLTSFLSVATSALYTTVSFKAIEPPNLGLQALTFSLCLDVSNLL